MRDQGFNRHELLPQTYGVTHEAPWQKVKLRGVISQISDFFFFFLQNKHDFFLIQQMQDVSLLCSCKNTGLTGQSGRLPHCRHVLKK